LSILAICFEAATQKSLSVSAVAFALASSTNMHTTTKEQIYSENQP